MLLRYNSFAFSIAQLVCTQDDIKYIEMKARAEFFCANMRDQFEFSFAIISLIFNTGTHTEFIAN
jgi:hypothetical protein